MASEQQVKQYLAYWFQLGKKVVIGGGQEALLPHSVIQGDRYSPEFEACWQRILETGANQSYLESTHQTIAELLTDAWELNPCARCSMPVPVHSVGMPSSSCPCVDLPNWPDTEMPQPRAPMNNQVLLMRIRDRLRQKSSS